MESARQPVGATKREPAGPVQLRINDQFRLCFIWRGKGAYEVEIVDYH